jgi:hypothetical protein
MQIEIFYDDEQEIRWFRELDKRLKESKSKKIRPRGSNYNQMIEEIIIYDRPDIVLCVDGKPKLVIEKSEEVPSGHNVGQRIARLARAIEMGVPFIKFFPFLAMKHGDYASRCFVRPNIFLAFKNMKKIHGAHALAVNWPCDDDHELIRDGSENAKMVEIIKGFLDNDFSMNGLEVVTEVERIMENEYKTRVSSNSKYRGFPKSISLVDTKSFVENLGRRFPKEKLPDIFNSRKSVLLYEIGMTEENCRREDPYTGMQFIYDYVYCRTGSKVTDRRSSFVLHFPRISKRRWMQANPFNKLRKSYLWYALADLMIFSDGILKREGFGAP